MNDTLRSGLDRRVANATQGWMALETAMDGFQGGALQGRENLSFDFPVKHGDDPVTILDKFPEDIRGRVQVVVGSVEPGTEIKEGRRVLSQGEWERLQARLAREYARLNGGKSEFVHLAAGDRLALTPEGEPIEEALWMIYREGWAPKPAYPGEREPFHFNPTSTYRANIEMNGPLLPNTLDALVRRRLNGSPIPLPSELVDALFIGHGFELVELTGEGNSLKAGEICVTVELDSRRQDNLEYATKGHGVRAFRVVEVEGNVMKGLDAEMDLERRRVPSEWSDFSRFAIELSSFRVFKVVSKNP